jgi:V8-like Glu-specific endopeptidase
MMVRERSLFTTIAIGLFLLIATPETHAASQRDLLTASLAWSSLDRSIGRCHIKRYEPEEAESHCTCFVVARDIIMTAHHCLRSDYATLSGVGPKATFRFALGEDERGAYSGHKATEILARGVGAKDDWIALRVTPPMNDAIPIEIASPADYRDSLIALVGYGKYPGDRPVYDRYTFSPTMALCSIVSLTADQIRHSCPAVGGHSGSPILALDLKHTRWVVIGVTSKAETSPIDILEAAPGGIRLVSRPIEKSSTAIGYAAPLSLGIREKVLGSPAKMNND